MATQLHNSSLAARRVLVLRVMVICMFTTVWLRLWQMQVWQVDKYTQTMLDKVLVTRRLPAPRGRIVDRNGLPLADNKATWAVVVTPSRVPAYKGGKPKPEEFYPIAAELSRVFNRPDLPAEEALKRMTAELPSDAFRARLVVDDVAEETRCRIKELGLELQGVDVVLRYVRDYPHPDGANAYHVVGYASNLTAGQVKAGKLAEGYEYSDIIGQLGVESSYEKVLRGAKGLEKIDARGVPTVESPPRAGDDLILSLDSELQARTEDALARWVAHKGHRGGAAIVMDCRNGQILALASYPTFHPEWCTGQATPEDRKKFADVAKHPGLPWSDHAISGRRNPASTFKIITMASALEMASYLGLDTFGPNTHEYCRGSIVVGKERGETRTKKCWNKNGHGWVGLRDAIAESCNIMFYRAGRELHMAGGPEGQLLQQGARAFGLGSKTGIDLEGEYEGLVGDPRWLAQQNQIRDDVEDGWYLGLTMGMAIGQGYIEATPIQMACATAVIANGGTLVWPHLVKEVRSGDQPVEYTYPFPDSPPHTPRPITLSPQTLSIIRDGMRMAISMSRGTGYGAFKDFTRTQIAGKTGTDEVCDNSWFTSFAPAGDPRIVVTVFIEAGGHGSASAAPAAKEIYEAAFDQQGRLRVGLNR